MEEKQKKAKAIESLIRKYLGENAYEDIYRALLADDPEKANAVFMTMQEARRIKRQQKDHGALRSPRPWQRCLR